MFYQDKNDLFSKIAGHCFNKEGEFDPSGYATREAGNFMLATRHKFIANAIEDFLYENEDLIYSYYNGDRNQEPNDESLAIDHSEMVRQTILDSQAILESSLK